MKWLRRLATLSIVSVVGLTTGTAWAGYKMEIDEFKWISLGIGARFEAGAAEQGSDNKWGKNFNVDSIRPYISGQVHEYIKFEANFDFTTGTDLNTTFRLLDGIVKFEFNDQVNIWGGRFLPPTDRANFSGPYYLNTWAFPLVAQRYPQIFAGRDNGVAFWGYDPSGRFKYQAGVFEGNSGATTPSFDARFTLNLLDKETGYYNASTYFGEKDILALGFAINAQPGGSGRDFNGKKRSFVGMNVDLLFEKAFGNAGALMIDAAYYNYDDDGFDGTTSPRADGDGFFVTTGWYLPGEYGIGRMQGLLQPHFRYQAFEHDAGADESRWDVGINWYILQQNAKFVLYYSRHDDGGSLHAARDAVNLGFQLQF